jgi:hypothetical protein
MTIIEHMKSQLYPRQVGEDRILRHGEQLVVCSKVDMDGWRVQETRKTAIIIACKGADEKKKIEERSDTFLYPFRGLIGFLPSYRKAAIEKKFGLPARNATIASIMIEFYILVLLGFFWWVFILVGPVVYLAYLSVIVLFVDIIFRYGSYFRDDAIQYGFLEWFFLFLCRKYMRKSRPGRNVKDVDLLFPYK